MKVLQKIKKPIIFLLLAALAVLYYFYLSNRDVDNSTKEQDNSVVTNIISKDLDKNYPGSPKSVVSYYSDILKVMYKEDYSDEEFKGIVDHIRGLFDEELLLKNKYDEYSETLSKEVNAYKDANKFITEYKIEDGYNIKYFSHDKKDYARLDVRYFVREGSSLVNTYEKFTLRKDVSGNWKILYWELSNEAAMDE